MSPLILTDPYVIDLSLYIYIWLMVGFGAKLYL
jgi:hypothetical protein